MRTLFLAAILISTGLDSFGQGQVIFANSSTTLITNCTGLLAAGGPAQNDTQVGLYVGNVGDSVGSLQLIGATTNLFSPGRFSGGTRTLAGWTGTVQLQVRVWLASVVYPSYEAAIAASIGGDSSAFVAASNPFTFTLTLPPSPANSIAGNGLTPFILGCPEPSAYALALAGLVVVALFRSKK